MKILSIDEIEFPSAIRYKTSHTRIDRIVKMSEDVRSSSVDVSLPNRVPRGLVSQRRALFGTQSTLLNTPPHSRPSSSVPPACSKENEIPSEPDARRTRSQPRQVQIDITRFGVRAPAELAREHPDEETTTEGQRKVTITRQVTSCVNGAPFISIQQESRTSRIPPRPPSGRGRPPSRSYPVVTVNVTEPDSGPPQKPKRVIPVDIRAKKDEKESGGTQRTPSPPIDYPTASPTSSTAPMTSSSSIPVQRSFTTTPVRPNSNRTMQLERYDVLSRSMSPLRTKTEDHLLRSKIDIEEGTAIHMDEQHRNRSLVNQSIMERERLRKSEADLRSDGRMAEGSRIRPTWRIEKAYENDDWQKEAFRSRQRELESAKHTIKRLSCDLARLERDKQELEIETSLRDEKKGAREASHVADMISHQRQNSGDRSALASDHHIKTGISSETILEECTRMMRTLKERESTENEEGADTAIEREIERLKWQVSGRSTMGLEPDSISYKSHKMDSLRGSVGSNDSTQIISVKDQAVMYTSGGLGRQESLVSRLERELTDAQQCNHRLNAQLGSLATNGSLSIKKEIVELKKELKDTRSENEQLKKKLHKSERDRQQWDAQKKQLESKLPMDVQLLMAQKRELTMQLDREQSEKHELFLQINSMIAQLADSGDAEQFKEENRTLKKKIDELESISSAESTRFEGELRRSKEELELIQKTSEVEKKKWQSEAEEARKELNMKAAALQSVMLAKQDTSKLDKMAEESRVLEERIKELESSLTMARNEITEKNTELGRLNDISTEHSTLRTSHDDLQKKFEQLETEMHKEKQNNISLEAARSELDSKLKELQSKLDESTKHAQKSETDAAALRTELETLTREYSTVSEQLRQSKSNSDEETMFMKERIAVLEATLKEKDGKIDSTRVALLAAESRAAQAESDLRTTDSNYKNAERRATQMQAQLDAAGDESKELDLLREELKKSEDRHNLVLGRLQKAESAQQDSSNESKRRVEQLESELQEAKEASSRLHNEIGKKEEKISSLESRLSESTTSSQSTSETVNRLQKDIEQLQAENKKLESKASVADELAPLMSSLQAVRTENGQYQEEISSLHSEINALREEIEGLSEESAEWKSRAEEAETQRSSLEREMKNERERLQLLTSSQESNETAATKLHDDNTKLQAEISKLQLEKNKLESENSKMQSENAKLQCDVTTLEQKTHSFDTTNEELRSEMSKLQADVTKLQSEKDTSTASVADLEAKIAAKEKDHQEASSSVEKKLRELTERCDAVQREADSNKERVKELEEERSRVIGSSDEEKQRLLEDVRSQREKADNAKLELESLKDKLKSVEEEADAHSVRANQLDTRLAQVEKEYSESKAALGVSSQESAEKMREAESFASKIKQQLEELEKEKQENSKRFEDVQTASRLELEQLEKEKEHAIEEATEKTREVEKELEKLAKEKERAIEEAEEKTRELEKLKRELETAEKERSESSLEEKQQLEKKVTDLEVKLAAANKSQTDLLTNVRSMTELLETESKRMEEVSAEKRRFKELAEERERLLEEAKNAPANDSSELIAENARLAGELLKARSQNERTLDSERDQTSEKLKGIAEEKDRLSAELTATKSRVEELNRAIVNTEKKRKDEVSAVYNQLEMVKGERERLQDKIDQMYQNGQPVAPPRRISNMSSITNFTTADFSEIEDVDILRKEIDKQKRLIIVLRRKLQGLQS